MPKKKVLILDDDETVHFLLSNLIDQKIFEITSVYTGSELLNLIKEESFDIFILDLIIPNEQGALFVIDKLSKISPNSRKILCTGHGSNPVVKNYEKYHFDGVILKPFIPKQINDILTVTNLNFKK